MKYDDGFVAYLNGVEVARRNVEGEPSFDVQAKGHNDKDAVVFEDIAISQHIDALRVGDNILAIHGVNINPTNSDMLISPELVSGVFGDASAAGIPDAQVGSPRIQLDDFVDGLANSNHDEAFIQLTNPNDTAVDISDWQLSGGIQYTFQPGTVIPAHGSVYVAADIKAFRSRQTAPTGGMGLFVQGNFQGQLSDVHGAVELKSHGGDLIAVMRPSGAHYRGFQPRRSVQPT